MVSQRVFVLLTAIFAGFLALLWARHGASSQKDSLVIDVGYAKYQGYYDAELQSNVWLGLRYASPPARFQRAEPPRKTDTGTVQASQRGTVCAQMSTGPGITQSELKIGAEDCLFLNVYAPKNASRISRAPVVVWIHGGGYGYGTPNAFGEESKVLEIDGGKTILVSIAYRTNIFGFLSSSEIKEQGNVNLGIHDQLLALQWVHDHIAEFGGDPDHVTIWGESAGGGSVMLLSQAYGGGLNISLWRGAISNSPYFPPQYTYNDAVPRSYYDALTKATNCADKSDTFACLSAVPYEELFAAGAKIIPEIAPYSHWGPAPVTDNELLLSNPTTALVPGKVNGEYIYTGHVGSEGTVFISPDLATSADFEAWFHKVYPTLSDSYSRVIQAYPEPAESGGVYATQAERAAKLYGDWTFDCPSYYLASAFAPSKAWKYVDDVQPAVHGRDLQTFFLGDMFPDFATDMPSQRAAIVGSLAAFWQSFNPGRNPVLNGLELRAFEKRNGYPELIYNLTEDGKTKASIRELKGPIPEVCNILKDILRET